MDSVGSSKTLVNICHITHYIKSNSNIQSPPWEPCRHCRALSLANLSFLMLVIFSANFAKCTPTVKEESTVETFVSERWLSWSPITRFGLALQVNLSRSLKTCLSLKLPVIGSSTVLSLILRRSRTGTVWFYTSTSNKRAARPKLYTEN